MTVTKNNFVYVTSWDQLTWIVDHNATIGVYRCMIPWSSRQDVKQWINACCSDTVYCWNGTSKPEPGAQNWGYLISPHEERCYRIFTDNKDESMLCLKYTEPLKVQRHRTLHSAWRDAQRPV